MADSVTHGSVAINNEVIIKIAGLAAKEVEGVAGLSNRPVKLGDFKGLMNNAGGEHSRKASIFVDNGVLIIDVYVSLYDNAKVNTVAENVQRAVKDKVQEMTGCAVARVNVHIDDVVKNTAEE